MKDIEPNLKLNKIAAGLIGILALYFLYLAYDTQTRVESTEWGFEWCIVAVIAGIGGILALYALLLLRASPINVARLRFRSDGFRLETKRVFRGSKVFDLDWADITRVTSRDEGLYGGRSIHVAHGRAGDVAMLSTAWTECSSDDIIDRLQSSAEASGYRFYKVGGTSLRFTFRTFFHFEESWTVTKKA
jgi:hypothetical protein